MKHITSKLLSLLLCLAMLMSMVPAAYAAGTEGTDGDNTLTEANGGASEQAVATIDAAKVGETGYATLAEAITAAEDGETVTLLADVIQNTMLTIDKNITLDLNGKKIYNTENIWSDTKQTYELISVEAKVTITGNGSIEAKENDCYTINVKNGNLTIENGTFVGNISVVQVEKGTLTISGGEFKLLQKWEGSSKYLINCIDKNYENKTAVVDIRGGKFVDFDPNVAPEKKVDGKAPSFVISAGIGVTKDAAGSFTAVPNMAAQIVDTDGNSVAAYATLQEAFANVKTGDTVTLLADTKEDVTINKNITLDLGGKTLTNTNAGKATLSVSGTATVKNGTIEGGTSYYNIAVGTKEAPGGNLTLENVEATAGNYDASMIDNWGTLTIKSGTYTGGLNVVKSEPGANLVIDNGKFTLDHSKGGYTATIYNYGTATINNGEFYQIATTPYLAYPEVIMNGKDGDATPNMTVKNGTFVNKHSKGKIFWCYGNATPDTMHVTGGKFSKTVSSSYLMDGYATLRVGDWYVLGKAAEKVSLDKHEVTLNIGETVTLTATVTPDDAAQAVVWSSKNSPIAAVENGVVTAKSRGETTITVTATGKNKYDTCKVIVLAPADVKTGTPVVEGAEGVDKTAVDAVSKTKMSIGSGSDAGLTTAARKVSDGITTAPTKTEYMAKAPEGAAEPAADAHFTTIIAPRLDIKVNAYDATEKVLTLDIKAVYDIKVTIATGSKLTEFNGSNADKVDTVTVKTNAGTLDTTGQTVKFKLYLPTDFAKSGEYIYVMHTKDSGEKYIYCLRVYGSSAPYVTVDNKNGFSSFVVSKTKEVAASITADSTTIYYETLQDAVNAVKDGQTIKLEADDAETATVSRTVKFTLDKNSHVFTGSIKAGSYTTVTATDTDPVEYTFTYSRPSSGSSSYDPTYSVSTPSKTEHGTVTVSPKNASKGDRVTVTVKPDSGYVLETLTVTDKNGNELTLKDKGDGKYTFTMPAGKVEVKATFMEDNSVLNFFYDVPNDAFFYEAVKWAVKSGVTNGLSDTMFGPYESCTRAQIVTFLWRAAGSPEPKAMSSFTDVPASAYYVKAVAWAVENGITNGMTATEFAPDATCTRGQSVTFLHRALKGTASGSANFTDVKSDAFYADAINWAVANNVTNGTSNTTFSPNADCTRAEIVTFLYRAYQGK